MPTWFGGVQGPQFHHRAHVGHQRRDHPRLLFRYAYDWDHIFTDDIFRGLLLWLGFFCLLFLWLQLQQNITGLFAAPVDPDRRSPGQSDQPHLPHLDVAGFPDSVVHFRPDARPTLFTKRRAVISGLAVLTATILEGAVRRRRVLASHVRYLRGRPGRHIPSLIELRIDLRDDRHGLSSVLLTIAKIVPVVELHAIEHLREDHENE